MSVNNCAKHGQCMACETCSQEKIESLTRENERLREALKRVEPMYAEMSRYALPDMAKDTATFNFIEAIRRKVRAALSNKEGE